jgi:hypothetical protein
MYPMRIASVKMVLMKVKMTIKRSPVMQILADDVLPGIRRRPTEACRLSPHS